nr:ComEC/Rec2 family competence protein [uncultured Capnocytophaga sp.]
MKPTPFNLPLFIILFGIISGIIFQDISAVLSIKNSIFICVISISVLFFSFYIIKKFQKISIFIASFSVGILTYSIHYQPNKSNHYLNLLSENTDYTISGIIENIKGKNIFISLQNIDNQEISGKILLHINDSLDSNNIGRPILFATNFFPFKDIKNPYQFNYKRYMERQYIYWQGFSSLYRIGEERSFSLIYIAKKIQNYLSSSLDKYEISESTRGITKALILGVRTDIAPDIYEQYIDAGAVHILAISGLHIGIITLLLTQIINIFIPTNRKKLKIGIILIILLTYSLITGLSASVLRAVLMFGAYSISSLSGNNKARFDSLILAAFILILCKPTFLFDVGFQLSFLAVLSILIFFPVFNQYFFFENKYLNFFPNLIKVSISAQIGIIPISLYYFHQFSGLFLVSSIVILPFLGIILALGLGIIALCSLGWVPKWLLIGYDFIISLMNKSIEQIASLRFIIENIYFDDIMLFVSYFSLISGVIYLYIKKIHFLYFSLLSFLCLQTYLFYTKFQTGTTNELIVYQQYKKSMISIQEGNKMTLFSSDSVNFSNKYIKRLITEKHIKNLEYKPLPNVLPLKEINFLIIDDKFYVDNSFPVDYLLLRNSPKIHLEKLLTQITPKLIIADGSNFYFSIEKWRKTCKEYQIPFHYTQEDGFLSLSL